jgi:hypothetical protein
LKGKQAMSVLVRIEGVPVEEVVHKVELLRELVGADPETRIYCSMRGNVRDDHGNVWGVGEKLQDYVLMGMPTEDGHVTLTYGDGHEVVVTPKWKMIDHLRLYYPEGPEA